MLKDFFNTLEKMDKITVTKLPTKCKCGVDSFIHFNSYTHSTVYLCTECNKMYVINNKK